jgi:glycerophosphoryl diester phosphodiesterase
MLKKINLIPAWFTEYFRPCSVLRKQKTDDMLFLVIGHRGSPTIEIENTIASYERALQEGANSLEVDLCITKDNEVVLWHDWSPNDTTALLRESGFEPWVRFKPHPPPITSGFRKPIKELLLKEFLDSYDYKEREDEHGFAKAEIPVLKDLFKWGAKKKGLKLICFDVKTPGGEAEYAVPIANEIKKLIDQYNPVFDILIETTEPSVLKILKEKFPYFCYALDIEPAAGLILDPSEYSAVKAALDNDTHYPVALRPRKITVANFTTYRRIIRHDVKLRNNHNKNNSAPLKQFIGGTVNKKKEMTCLLKLGIGGLQTDFPERLRALAEKNGKNL